MFAENYSNAMKGTFSIRVFDSFESDKLIFERTHQWAYSTDTERTSTKRTPECTDAQYAALCAFFTPEYLMRTTTLNLAGYREGDVGDMGMTKVDELGYVVYAGDIESEFDGELSY